MIKTALVSIFFTIASNADAQGILRKNIFEELTLPDPSGSKVIVHQDKRLENNILDSYQRKFSSDTIIQTKQTLKTYYRVQVFSSNAQKNGKAEAFKREIVIREKFPDIPVYVNFQSPSWKVRIGDFSTRQQAQTFCKQLIDTLPQFSKDAYIVREKGVE